MRDRVTLSPKGVALLVWFARYVWMHGNVTKEAKQAATLLRSLCGDEALPEFDEHRSEIQFDGMKAQHGLKLRLAELVDSRWASDELPKA